MEKKGNRSVQATTKGLGTDKKSLDVSSGKPWPRGGRRREPNGGSFSTKNENIRKPTPQRNKCFDKRPRSRGIYNPCPVGGNENTRLEEIDEAELGSVFVQGSKKQSLNHLLNFHYTPYERQWSSGKLNNTKSNQKWISTNKHKYNKEQFLQANCQFIVKASGDYKKYVNNPDVLVDWNLIEQVNVQVSEFPSCPICLYPPIAAKMTHCGHIYCWSCMLHYLALSDKSSRKCPICYESVHKEDLKSVISIAHNSFNVNDEITFKLMKRVRGSLIAYPADQHIQDQSLFNVSNSLISKIYCKLLLATTNDVMKIIEREKNELKNQLLEDENAPEKCFIQEAMNLLNVRESVTLTNFIPEPVLNLKQDVSHDNIFEFDMEKNCEKFKNMDVASGTDRKHLESISSDNFSIDDVATNISIEDLDISHSQNQPPAKIFYFYQASDGQHIYLHALNVRMLEHTYGLLENCPLTVKGKILEKETGSMTEELRKRLRYLQHLPVTCQFEVAEIQLNQSLVSKETFVEFRDQIENRKKRRQKRAREEKRREKRIAEAENRMYGKYPEATEANIQIDSHYQFPEFDGTGFEASHNSEMGTSPTCSSTAGSMENDHCGISFAKMLTSASTKKPLWPQLKTNVTSVPKLINITGSQSKPITIKSTKNGSDTEPETEDYVAVPAFNRNFSDAIALALEKAAHSNDVTCDSGKGAKKKKKNKQKVLFATSMTYGNNN